MEENLYAAPEAALSVAGDTGQARAEEIRRELISHEANLRTLGALFVLGGIGSAIGTLGLVIGGIAGVLSGEADAPIGSGIAIGVGVLLAALSFVQFRAGLGLRRLDGRARTASILLSVLMMLNIGLGTLLGIWGLYLLLSARGKRVLTEEYRRIREATPHIRLRTSIVVWIVLALLVALLIWIVVSAGV